MKKFGNRLAAGLLAVSLTASLAACGRKGNDSQQLSGTVYVADFKDVQIENTEYVSQGCGDAQYLYFVASIQGEEKEETWTDPNTGETETYTYFETRPGLFRVSLDGGPAAELENYTLPAVPDGAEGNVYLQDIQTGEDNTIWVSEAMTVYTYDFPDGYDTEASPDENWQYQTGYEETAIRRRLDSTGAELERYDISDLAEKAASEYIYGISFDQAGNIYLASETKLTILDKTLNPLFELEAEQTGDIIQLGGGGMGMLVSYSDEEKNSYGYKMMTIDSASQSWGQEYILSQNAYSAFPGGGDYLFYYQNGDSIYGWKPGAAEGEKIFSWLSAGVDRSDVSFFTFLPDGRVAALLQSYNHSASLSDPSTRRTPEMELAILTPTDAKDLPEKTTLTLATMWLSYNTRSKIQEFNQESSTCRIEVLDYSEYNTGEDDSAGLTKLNTEIIAGNVPDIFYVSSSIPISRYAAKDILEDLWPYIEQDAEIGGREALMEHVLETASADGKLYQAFSTFGIMSVVAPASLTGSRMSWTLADLKAALASMPEGCTILGQSDTKDGMLNRVLSMNMEQFVDWDSGTCSFDSDAFKALLDFCNSFPAEFDWEKFYAENNEWESDYQRALNGKQMLLTAYLYDFTRANLYSQLFNGASYVGYPMEDGSAGSCFSINESYAMSSTCKDKEAAWSFIRQVFLPTAEDYTESGERVYFDGFPVNKSDFEVLKEQSMETVYETDENGQPILDENGQPIPVIMDSWYINDNQRIEITAATQEDVDQVMALYDSITSVYGYDESLYGIVEEVTGAYFAGDSDVDKCAGEIQNRVQLYMGENM